MMIIGRYRASFIRDLWPSCDPKVKYYLVRERERKTDSFIGEETDRKFECADIVYCFSLHDTHMRATRVLN